VRLYVSLRSRVHRSVCSVPLGETVLERERGKLNEGDDETDGDGVRVPIETELVRRDVAVFVSDSVCGAELDRVRRRVSVSVRDVAVTDTVGLNVCSFDSVLVFESSSDTDRLRVGPVCDRERVRLCVSVLYHVCVRVRLKGISKKRAMAASWYVFSHRAARREPPGSEVPVVPAPPAHETVLPSTT